MSGLSGLSGLSGSTRAVLLLLLQRVRVLSVFSAFLSLEVWPGEFTVATAFTSSGVEAEEQAGKRQIMVKELL